MKNASLLFMFLSLNLIVTACLKNKAETSSCKGKTVLYRKVHVVDLMEKKIHYDQSVLTRGSQIIRVEKFEDLELERVDTTIECRGSFLLPAIADMHNHLTPSDFDFQNWTSEKQVQLAKDQVKFGIQAILNPNNSFESSSKFMELENSEDAPYLFYTGPSLGPEGGWGSHKVSTIQDIDLAIDNTLTTGGTFIKFTYDDMSWLGGEMPVMDTVMIKHIIQTAHDKNIKALAHVTDADKAKFLVQNGIDGIIHGIVSQEMDNSLLDLMKEREVIYIPTTVVYETSFGFQKSVAEQFKYDIWDYYPVSIRDSLTNDASERTWNTWWPKAKELSHRLPNVYTNTKRAMDQGITVMLGSDTGTPGVLPGISTYYEMILLEKSGLDPFEVLQCAIVNPIDFLGLTDHTGSISKNKKANMIFLSKNPAESIENIKSIWLVTHNGTIVSHRYKP